MSSFANAAIDRLAKPIAAGVEAECGCEIRSLHGDCDTVPARGLHEPNTQGRGLTSVNSVQRHPMLPDEVAIVNRIGLKNETGGQRENRRNGSGYQHEKHYYDAPDWHIAPS